MEPINSQGDSINNDANDGHGPSHREANSSGRDANTNPPGIKETNRDPKRGESGTNSVLASLSSSTPTALKLMKQIERF